MRKIIQIYDKNTIDFTKNGRVLNDTLSCSVEEELNGGYELTLEHPLDARLKWQELVEGNIIKADGQLFRIYNKKKVLNRIVVNARHIFYDLLDNFLEDVRPENLSGIAALDWILTRTQFPHNFTCTGDVTGSNTKYFIRKNPIEAIMGADGIINTWGGEIERDNFIIRYNQARGMDRGVHVRYGKNIVGIEENINIDSVCTRMMPIGKDGLLLTEKYIDSQYINNYPNPKIRKYEFNDFETEDALRSAATEFMTANKIDIPPANYKVDFIELSKTEEYKNYAVLERIYLGDIVTIKHSKYNIDLKAKVIKIKKNVLTNRIEEVELGNFKNNLASALSVISNNINNLKELQATDKTVLQQAIDNATNLLTTALGGYVLKRDGELLIMDTEDPMTATKVWRWNINGLGYSSTGINGPYGLAITMDGSIVASFITTGILNANIIKAGILKSFNNLSWLNMQDGTFNFADKVKFDGTNFDINAEAVKIAVGQIGGNNLLPNGGFRLGAWGNPILSYCAASDIRIRDSVNCISGKEYHWWATQAGGGAADATLQKDWDFDMPPGEYTFSFFKEQLTGITSVEILIFDNTTNWAVQFDTTITGGGKQSIPISLPIYCKRIRIILKAGNWVALGAEAFQVNFGDFKIESGDNATAWSPNANELKTTDVTVDTTGLTITNGKLSVKNGNNEVVIDGQYNMLKIVASGTAVLNFSSGVYESTITINHNLGYKPAFVIYGEENSDGVSSTLPGLAIENMSDDYLGFREYHSANVSSTEFTISYRRSLNNQGISGTLKYKYYLMKEAAI